jgi:hypothetical protein
MRDCDRLMADPAEGNKTKSSMPSCINEFVKSVLAAAPPALNLNKA